MRWPNRSFLARRRARNNQRPVVQVHPPPRRQESSPARPRQARGFTGSAKASGRFRCAQPSPTPSNPGSARRGRTRNQISTGERWEIGVSNPLGPRSIDLRHWRAALFKGGPKPSFLRRQGPRATPPACCKSRYRPAEARKRNGPGHQPAASGNSVMGREFEKVSEDRRISELFWWGPRGD